MRGQLLKKALLLRWSSFPARTPISKHDRVLVRWDGGKACDEGNFRHLHLCDSVDSGQHGEGPNTKVCLANEWSNWGTSCFPRRSGSVIIYNSMGHAADFRHVRAVQTKQYSGVDATETSDRSCWSCKHGMSTGRELLCPACNAIQPVDPAVNYYQLFEIDKAFDVDCKLLEQKYKNLQKKLHPDLVASKSQKEQEYSAEQSAHVIQAYYTLLRPLSRARYMLRLQGIEVEEEGTIDDPDLLMQIMEIRESIENVSDAKELMNVQAENNERTLRCEKELDNYFRANDFKQAVSRVQRLAYYNKIGEEILRKL